MHRPFSGTNPPQPQQPLQNLEGMPGPRSHPYTYNHVERGGPNYISSLQFGSPGTYYVDVNFGWNAGPNPGLRQAPVGFGFQPAVMSTPSAHPSLPTPPAPNASVRGVAPCSPSTPLVGSRSGIVGNPSALFFNEGQNASAHGIPPGSPSATLIGSQSGIVGKPSAIFTNEERHCSVHGLASGSPSTSQMEIGSPALQTPTPDSPSHRFVSESPTIEQLKERQRQQNPIF